MGDTNLDQLDSTADVDVPTEAAGDHADLLRESGSPAAAQSEEQIEGPIYVARLALALLRLPADQEPIFTSPEARKLAAKTDEAMREALLADPRVSEVLDRHEPYVVDNARTLEYFSFDSNAADLPSAVTTRQAFRLNSPIWFRVRVPAKNQPLYRSLDDVPADDYLAVWDGISLGVQWHQEDARATGSGGHVVLEILETVGEAAGHPIDIMACSPGCHHRFMHIDVLTVRDDPEPPDHYHVIAPTPVGTAIVSPRRYDEDDQRNLRRVYSDLRMPLDEFLETKALADRILFLEHRARRNSAQMLGLGYQRASRRRLPNLPGLISDAWDLRAARRETRKLMAGLWLGLSLVDYSVGQWRVHNGHLVEVLDTHYLREIASEFNTEAEAIETLDLTLVRASLEETANRLEGRNMAIATLTGAAAALAGSAITALLT